MEVISTGSQIGDGGGGGVGAGIGSSDRRVPVIVQRQKKHHPDFYNDMWSGSTEWRIGNLSSGILYSSILEDEPTSLWVLREMKNEQNEPVVHVSAFFMDAKYGVLNSLGYLTMRTGRCYEMVNKCAEMHRRDID